MCMHPDSIQRRQRLKINLFFILFLLATGFFQFTGAFFKINTQLVSPLEQLHFLAYGTAQFHQFGFPQKKHPDIICQGAFYHIPPIKNCSRFKHSRILWNLPETPNLTPSNSPLLQGAPTARPPASVVHQPTARQPGPLNRLRPPLPASTCVACGDIL